MRTYFPRGVPSNFFEFDPLYEEGSRISRVPVALYRAIGARETSNDPGQVNDIGATGLMQLLPVVREDWNKRVAAKRGMPPLSQQDLLDPKVNVAVASWFMKQIVDMLAKHPSAGPVDWSSPRFVRLFVFAYHAGPGGVSNAIDLADRTGLPITVENLITVSRQSKRNLGSTFRYASNNPSMLDDIAEYDKGTALLYDKTSGLAKGQFPADMAIARAPKKRPPTGAGLGALVIGVVAAATGFALASQSHQPQV